MQRHWIASLALVILGGAGPVLAGEPPALTLPVPDVDAVLAADARAGADPQPYRFAVPIPVRITPDTHGRWTELEDGRRQWRLTIHAPGARSLNFGFTRYALPAGAELQLSGARDAHGPYAASHNRQGRLWTPVLRGERVTLVLTVPAGTQATLELGQVGYGFRGFGSEDAAQSKSGDCNVDVVCPQGDEWRNEIRSAARITINGLFLCSGQLLNNTAQDFTPYFLTAAHCLSSDVDAIGTVFYFNYETSSCGGTPDGDLSQTVSGATLRATSEAPSLLSPNLASDFTLVEMLEQPPAEFEVYYSGWDNRDIAPEQVTAIHHPAGDEKRISFEFDPLAVAAYAQNPGSLLSSVNPTHLKVNDWDIGTTEGGSSGSGIWNAEHRLVGQLSGGSAACGNDSPDWYGRFHSNWFRLQTTRTSLASWLDPLGSGAEVLDGADPASGEKTRAASPLPRQATSEPATAGGMLGGWWLGVLLIVLGRRAYALVHPRREG